MRDSILQGDCLEVLARLPAASVHTIVTSPPYWGLRDYGAPGQLGLEATPDEYVARLVAVFREARRVLRDDGTLWLNLGDSYAASGVIDPYRRTSSGKLMPPQGRAPRTGNLKPKDLVGIPWRVAFALQSDGWWLRSDIIWHKPNCMPESVRDRPTKAHEYVFLLAKSERYYYDASAVMEPAAPQSLARIRQRTFAQQTGGPKDYRVTGINSNRSMRQTLENFAKNPRRNKRDVWSVATAPYKGAHFAVMPPALVEPCILAGCPGRVCETCGAPWVRVVEREQEPRKAREGGLDRQIQARYRGMGNTSSLITGLVNITRTTGYRPTCRCSTNTGAARGVVLDPFMGAGTVGLVARRQMRHYLGIELNPDYIALAEERIAAERQPVLWSA